MSLIRKLAQALRIGKARYIVGHDLNGNAYLELPPLSGSLDPRHTRRSIQWKEKRELGDYDQRSIPVQWVMWLRHTRRDAPSLEELQRDRERIAMTQANAARLALEDRQRRESEQRVRLEEYGEARERATQRLVRSAARGAVPTATEEAESRVTSEDVGQGGRLQQQRTPDEDVWAASRARLAAKGQLSAAEEPGAVSAALQQAMDRRAARRAERNDDEAERERARREMSKSPLDAFVPMPKARK
ncbi:related to Mimitin, mitochondrial precursor [Sporisorium reilianum SRZ2]|uniref:Related to Mimitin, mitochondrial n=1 Tax=Sporisorium reilianum (strain SRZ2) TaxID=999809 RepID=E7A1Z3_SPORE|nr:related to Mimitin, mitochondrial precursor [Sporisorium reilianum SRZ2]